MMSFNPIQINNKTFQLQELTFNQALKISAIDPKYNEKRLSEFLKSALSDHLIDVRDLSVQVRYYLLLQYLATQTKTIFAISDVDVGKYMLKTKQAESQISIDGVTVRLLTGHDAELLESNCASCAEWIACMIAMQLSFEKHDVLKGVLLPSQQDYETQFITRLDYVKNLPLTEFNVLYDQYELLLSQLSHLVEIVPSESGLALLPVNGGTDDAPMRFCPSTAFTGCIKYLDKRDS